MRLIQILITFLIPAFSSAKISKVISKETSQLRYISFSAPKIDGQITIYQDSKKIFFEYESDNFRFISDTVNKKNLYFIKVIKNKKLYNLSIKVAKNKVEEISLISDNNPIFYNLNYSVTCEGAKKDFLADFDFDRIGTSDLGNEPVLQFSNNCTSKLKDIYGPNFREIISNEVIMRPLWNNESVVNQLNRKLSNRNILSVSRKGLDDIRERRKKISPIDCENLNPCSANGSFSPTTQKISLYPNCLAENRDVKCNVFYTLSEEILHSITGVGNEQPAHDDLKLIAQKSSSCVDENFHQIELDTTTNRADFNQQTKIDIRPEQIPEPPAPPENLSQPFTMNPATDRPRTVMATRADQSFIAGLEPTISWAKNVATAAIGIAERSPSSTTSRRPANSLASRRATDLLSNQVSMNDRGKPSTPTRPTETSTEVAAVDTEALPNQKSPNELPRGRKASPQALANAPSSNRPSGAPVARTTSNSPARPQPRLPERTTASIPAQPIDASKMGSTLPTEISQVVANENIRSVPDLISRLKDSQQRQQLSLSLKEKKISIIGLGDQPLGETDLQKATSIYKYSTSGKSPRLINVRKNLPTNI